MVICDVHFGIVSKILGLTGKPPFPRSIT
jgi:hypothetical protein